MAALQCEICGGKLMAKSGGLFECEYCGMQYDKTRIQEMVQEIKGTVKVEGTVEIKGTVKVDGPVKVEGGVNAESLLKRGWMALEEAKWKEADGYFDEALNLNAESTDAYWGRLCAKYKCSTTDMLIAQYNVGLETDNDFQKVIRFSDDHAVAVLHKKLQTAFEKGVKNLVPARERIKPAQGLIAAGAYHALGVRADGIVRATTAGSNEGQINVGDWQDVVAVAAAGNHTVGLSSDGTVRDTSSEYSVFAWWDIVAIAAGFKFTVGLKDNGTVVAAGDNSHGQCEVDSWQNITTVAAGSYHTVGLCMDGKVVAAGKNDHGQCEVSGWTDIVAIAAKCNNTAGLRADGTVVTSAELAYGEVKSWRNIVAIAVGTNHLVGLKDDGTVLAVGYTNNGQCDVGDWKNIVAVDAGECFTMGLKEDGTVVSAGYKRTGNRILKYCQTEQWKLFDHLDTIDQEREKVRTYRAEQARIEAERLAEQERIEMEKKAAEEKKIQQHREKLNTEKNSLHTEQCNLKGLFTGKRRKEIEARLAEIETELKGL